MKCENNIIKQEGSLTCNDCGYIIGPIINYDDTRYYGIDDSKYTNNNEIWDTNKLMLQNRWKLLKPINIILYLYYIIIQHIIKREFINSFQ